MEKKVDGFEACFGGRKTGMGDSPSACECRRGLPMERKGLESDTRFLVGATLGCGVACPGCSGEDSSTSSAFQKWNSDNTDTNDLVTGKTDTLCKPTWLHKEPFDDLSCQSMKKVKIEYWTYWIWQYEYRLILTICEPCWYLVQIPFDSLCSFCVPLLAPASTCQKIALELLNLVLNYWRLPRN